MSCPTDAGLLLEYPRTVQLVFMSTTENANPLTAAGVTDATSGYVKEMDKLGQDHTGVGSKQPAATPYSTKLRPLRSLGELTTTEDVILQKVEFHAYDTVNPDDPGSNQNAANNTAIVSPTGTSKPFAQSGVLHGMMPPFQPNFFVPQVKIDNHSVIGALDSELSAGHAGDLSVGVPLPYCYDVMSRFTEIKNVEVYAQCAQYISRDYATDILRRYAVQCVMTFRLRK